MGWAGAVTKRAKRSMKRKRATVVPFICLHPSIEGYVLHTPQQLIRLFTQLGQHRLCAVPMAAISPPVPSITHYSPPAAPLARLLVYLCDLPLLLFGVYTPIFPNRRICVRASFLMCDFCRIVVLDTASPLTPQVLHFQVLHSQVPQSRLLLFPFSFLLALLAP